ncbi:MAG: hypothetical protein AAF197_07100 [Pseudomonadota bacterium]
MMQKILIAGLLLLLSGCGVDKFFIERAVNNVEKDVVKELNKFATLTDEQAALARSIAQQADQWVRDDIVMTLASHIDAMANDVETQGTLRVETWDQLTEFFYRPLPLSKNQVLVNQVALFFYQMDDAQDKEVREKLIEDYDERKEERDERDLKEQKKRIASTLKTIFRGLGVKRSKAQLDEMKQILDARRDVGELTNQYYLEVNEVFLDLTESKGMFENEFAPAYQAAWVKLEDGPSTRHPAEFKYNADNGLDAINYLFSTLSLTERKEAAVVMREYRDFFIGLSGTKES